ncbi:MAG TPA: chromate transporter [Stellaceae bacterium]|nr:chromate transporter [Stellaceae bacterium]
MSEQTSITPLATGADPIAPSVTLGALFSGFFGIGMMGFGGVLPLARRMIVDQRRWLTAAEFTDILSLCQFLPGPNIGNVSVVLGARFRGIPGSIAAFAGLMTMPMVIVLSLGALYTRFSHLEAVHHMFAGISAAAAGLVLAMGWQMAAPLRSRASGIVIMLLAFAGIAILRLPLLAVLLVLAPLSIALSWWQARRRTA